MTTSPHPDLDPQDPGHRFFIEAALEDWWINTDPTTPFDPRPVAQRIEEYLLGSGYYIGPDAHTCDASHTTGIGAVGPCILLRHHDGPVHQDARGTTWWHHPPRNDSTGLSLSLTFLVLVCLAATLTALTHHDWEWAITGGIGTFLLGHELTRDLAQHRSRR